MTLSRNYVFPAQLLNLEWVIREDWILYYRGKSICRHGSIFCMRGCKLCESQIMVCVVLTRSQIICLVFYQTIPTTQSYLRKIVIFHSITRLRNDIPV